VRWSRYEKTCIDLKSEVLGIWLPDITIQNDWENSWLFKGGLEYCVTENLSLRTGYAFVEAPAPDRTLSPASPDGHQHNITLGFGYGFGDYWLDAFYMLSLSEDRTVQNTVLSGTYENKAHYMGLSIGYKF
jgi:long-subunit fatty acid transport protein